jgi:hypothetical protein
VQDLASFTIQRSGIAVALELEEDGDFGEGSRAVLLFAVCVDCVVVAVVVCFAKTREISLELAITRDIVGWYYEPVPALIQLSDTQGMSTDK